MAVNGGAVKRAMSVPTTCTPAKAQRGPVSSEEDSWSCGSCGNLNYGARQVCNMRKCGAARPADKWVCAGCGNENFPGRLFCNMRRCQLAKPGLTAMALTTTQPAVAGGRGRVGMLEDTSAFTEEHPPGSWMCLACGNVNYPSRTTCNSGKCGRLRSECDGGQPPATMRGSKNPVVAAAAAWMGGGGMARNPYVTAAALTSPPGSWICINCKNVNYPGRTMCNARNCGQPRAEVDGGVPTIAGGGGFGSVFAAPAAEAPPGSWMCPCCQNVNWPLRQTCNKRTCGAARPSNV